MSGVGKMGGTYLLLPLTLLRSFVAVLEVKILVPGKPGLKVFLMKMGTPADTAGCMVLGWITLAPKYASSIASLKDTYEESYNQYYCPGGRLIDLRILRIYQENNTLTPKKILIHGQRRCA